MSLNAVTTSSVATPTYYIMTTSISSYMYSTVSSTPTTPLSRPTDTAHTGIVP